MEVGPGRGIKVPKKRHVLLLLFEWHFIPWPSGDIRLPSQDSWLWIWTTKKINEIDEPLDVRKEREFSKCSLIGHGQPHDEKVFKKTKVKSVKHVKNVGKRGVFIYTIPYA